VLDDTTLRYVYGLGRVSQVGSITHYYLADGLGSTTALTTATGGASNTYAYDVFGAVRASTGSQANEFKFTGEQVDASTEMEYLRARYYDPATGRFLSKDPLAHLPVQRMHAYTYVLSNPVNLLDQSGLQEEAGTPSERRYCGKSGGLLETFWNGTLNAAACRDAFDLANQANREAELRYGTSQDGTPGNSFLHCYWSGSMTLWLGTSRAKEIADVHEKDYGDLEQRALDQYNNGIGRLIGEKYFAMATEFDAAQRAIAESCQTQNSAGVLVTSVGDSRLSR